jgi:hypothetical protein
MMSSKYHSKRRTLYSWWNWDETLSGVGMAEEAFFTRLTVAADDYGRLTGEPAKLKALCFPYRQEITPDDVTRMLIALTNTIDSDGKALVEYYEVGNIAVVELNHRRWWEGNRRKAKDMRASEFPPNPKDQVPVHTYNPIIKALEESDRSGAKVEDIREVTVSPAQAATEVATAWNKTYGMRPRASWTDGTFQRVILRRIAQPTRIVDDAPGEAWPLRTLLRCVANLHEIRKHPLCRSYYMTVRPDDFIAKHAQYFTNFDEAMRVGLRAPSSKSELHRVRDAGFDVPHEGLTPE